MAAINTKEDIGILSGNFAAQAKLPSVASSTNQLKMVVRLRALMVDGTELTLRLTYRRR